MMLTGTAVENFRLSSDTTVKYMDISSSDAGILSTVAKAIGKEIPTKATAIGGVLLSLWQRTRMIVIVIDMNAKGKMIMNMNLVVGESVGSEVEVLGEYVGIIEGDRDRPVGYTEGSKLGNSGLTSSRILISVWTPAMVESNSITTKPF